MKLDRFEMRETAAGIERSARVRWAAGELRLWTAVPSELAAPGEDASPFLCPTLLCAMCLGEDLEVDGPVSPRLLRGLDQARDLYRAWAPTLHPTALRVAEERAPSRRSDAAVCFFSRGVDSTYSAAVPRSRPAPIARLVFVDRLEPVHDPDVRAAELRLAGEAAKRIGLPLSVVSTNVRELTDPIVHDWEDMAGAGLSFVALALAGGAGAAVIPSSLGPMMLPACGTSPLLDPLFSTEAVEIHHDSIARGRVAKTLWLAATLPDIAAGLKVCFKESRPDNCGRCSKCLLTMASLDAAGVLHQAEYFPHEIDLEKVAAMRLGDLRAKSDWAEMAVALHEPRHVRLRRAIHHALGYPAAPYPGRLPPEDSPGFGTRATLLTLALMRDGRPWPPVEEAEGKAHAPADTEAGSTRRFALLRRVSRLLG